MFYILKVLRFKFFKSFVFKKELSVFYQYLLNYVISILLNYFICSFFVVISIVCNFMLNIFMNPLDMESGNNSPVQKYFPKKLFENSFLVILLTTENSTLPKRYVLPIIEILMDRGNHPRFQKFLPFMILSERVYIEYRKRLLRTKYKTKDSKKISVT